MRGGGGSLTVQFVVFTARIAIDLKQVVDSIGLTQVCRAVARTPKGGGGIFIYSGDARLSSFEINFISKETSRAEPEYMNIHPPN